MVFAILLIMSLSFNLVVVLTLLATAYTSKAQQTVVLRINHRVGNQTLQLATSFYQTAHQERFQMTLLQYYLSNLQLVKADGSTWRLPPDSSYFLIKTFPSPTSSITLPNVPEGKYTALRFMVGIDSLRNTLPPSQRKGCLDIGGEANSMYWSWNAGYIFFKVEGISPQAPLDKTSGTHEFSFHVGLFGGMRVTTPNNTRQVELPFSGQPLQVARNSPSLVALQADISKLFDGVHVIRIAQFPHVMMHPIASQLADNFSHMFSLQRIP